MTKIIFYKNKNNNIMRFEINGHANLDIEGKDILCAAVSALASHTIGAIQEFTSEPCENIVDENEAKVIFALTGDAPCETARTFLDAFASSSEELSSIYPDNLIIEYKEC